MLVAGWNRSTCVPCRQSFLVCFFLAVPCLGTPPGVSPLLEDADGVLSLHFCFLTARIPLAAAQVQHLGSSARLAFGSAPLPRVAKKRPNTPALFAGGLDHLSAAAWVSPPCLASTPCKNQTTSQGREPKDLASANSQGQGPKHPDVACSPSVFFGFGFL